MDGPEIVMTHVLAGGIEELDGMPPAVTDGNRELDAGHTRHPVRGMRGGRRDLDSRRGSRVARPGPPRLGST
jgi:hypothetical protein